MIDNQGYAAPNLHSYIMSAKFMKNPTRLWHPPRKRGGLGRGSFIMAV